MPASRNRLLRTGVEPSAGTEPVPVAGQARGRHLLVAHARRRWRKHQSVFDGQELQRDRRGRARAAIRFPGNGSTVSDLTPEFRVKAAIEAGSRRLSSTSSTSRTTRRSRRSRPSSLRGKPGPRRASTTAIRSCTAGPTTGVCAHGIRLTARTSATGPRHSRSRLSNRRRRRRHHHRHRRRVEAEAEVRTPTPAIAARAVTSRIASPHATLRIWRRA